MGKIVGYAARYDKPSVDMGFVETIAPGAFDRVLQTKPDVVILYNHDMNQFLGRTASRTASVFTDNLGLAYACNLPDTQVGRDVYELVSRGDLTGSSFSFTVSADEWDMASNGKLTRRILDVKSLTDCSPVIAPAYPSTSVGID